MANEITYWDPIDKMQKVRDATPEELADIAQRQVDAQAAATARVLAKQKAAALEQYKGSVRREAEALEKEGNFVEAFLKLKTIGE